MSIAKPYYQNCRQFNDGSYANSGQSRYISDPRYAKEPGQYIRAFLLLQEDLKKLFNYIDTSDINLQCYSFRTHELLMRICIEVEANCKSILKAHGYEKKDKKGNPGKMDMRDYCKLETTHRLSQYQVKIPHWRGTCAIRTPFKSWATLKNNPDWYNAYHETKHNRHEGFENANFKNLIDAACGLLILLSSQFYTRDFSPGDCMLAVSGHGPDDGMEAAIGSYFRIKFPDWPTEEQYSFTYEDWKKMETEEMPFQQFDYTKIQ